MITMLLSSSSRGVQCRKFIRKSASQQLCRRLDHHQLANSRVNSRRQYSVTTPTALAAWWNPFSATPSPSDSSAVVGSNPGREVSLVKSMKLTTASIANFFSLYLIFNYLSYS